MDRHVHTKIAYINNRFESNRKYLHMWIGFHIIFAVLLTSDMKTDLIRESGIHNILCKCIIIVKMQ